MRMRIVVAYLARCCLLAFAKPSVVRSLSRTCVIILMAKANDGRSGGHVYWQDTLGDDRSGRGCEWRVDRSLVIAREA